MLSIFSLIQNYLKNQFRDDNAKINPYWVNESVSDIVKEADRLYIEDNYLEVYGLLNRFRFDTNADIQWRICRSLFKMSFDLSLPVSVRNGMIEEAYGLISDRSVLDQSNANVHKWMAILTDLKSSLEGTQARVKSYGIVKEHLLKATIFNPNDVSVLYMLGKWCYDMSNLTWFQRKISSLLFADPPTSSYDEAFQYFLNAENLKPRFYLPNVYMLGCVSMHLRQYFRARYYLNIAAALSPRTHFEKMCVLRAKILARELREFDTSEQALFHNRMRTHSNFE